MLTTEPTATEIAADIAAGRLSSIAATEAAIARIEALDGPVNAVILRDFDRALDQAAAADARIAAGETAPLLGVPMTVKESFNVAGLQTCWGVAEAAGNIAAEDAAVVTRLKAAGAVILGKTNVPPMLTDWHADNPVYGRTNNPHDHTRSPGGSSGGAAAAVASGMVAAEFGSDIGGSIRVPAHYCGIWGHKPTYGVISTAGHFPPGLEEGAEPVLAVAGPLARSAADLARLMEITLDRPLEKLSGKLAGSRILLLTEHPVVQIGTAMAELVDNVAARLATAGATVLRTSDVLPALDQQHRDYMHMLNIAVTAGAPRPDGSEVTVREWLRLCDQQARNIRSWNRLFDTVDFVLAPVASTPAYPHSDRDMRNRTLAIDGVETPFAEQLAWAGLVSFPNLPATVFPAGKIDGLPAGLQLIGNRFEDYKTIDLARQIGELIDSN